MFLEINHGNVLFQVVDMVKQFSENLEYNRKCRVVIFDNDKT